MPIKLRDLIRHPFTLATAITGTLGGLMHFAVLKAVWMALWSSLPTLFPAVSITAFTLAPEVDFLTPYVDDIKIIAIVVGVLFVLRLLSKAYTNVQSRLNNRL